MAKTMATADIFDPELAIKVSRRTLAEWELNNSASLAAWLPSQEVKDFAYEIEYQDDNPITAANWRSFDGNATSETWGSGARATGSLQPISRTFTFGEYDKVRNRVDADEAIARSLTELIVRATKAIAIQVNLQRAKAIFEAKVHIQGSGGLNIEADFNRKPEFNPTATKLFSDPTADPFYQLLLWSEQYEDQNFTQADQMWMSKAVWRNFVRHPKVIASVHPEYARTPTYANKAAVDEQLMTLGLPPIVVKAGSKVKVDDLSTGKQKLVDVMPQDKVFFMPKPGKAGQPDSFEDYGLTIWGESANTDLPGVREAMGDFDTPGIVSGVLVSDSFPIATEVFADALVMPVVIKPNAVLAGKVL